ncbi:hypothetical protein LY78DRAFT_648761 [Colletotrichum sublineola]|nr:hypothetical protein LY78DRAFT_648761 [Colletotrichum sublineola]
MAIFDTVSQSYEDHITQFADMNVDDQWRRIQTEGWPASPNPSDESRLAVYEVAAIIANRMIGTGVFEAPTQVFRKAPTVGLGLMYWLIGCFATLCGSLLYVEYGLTIPQTSPDGDKDECIPTNGGELNYMRYLISEPPGLAAFLFGVPFILIGTSAANAISFSRNLFELVNVEKPSAVAIICVAIGSVGFACLVHAFSRGIGIKLNNAFAALKIIFLIIIVFGGLAVGVGRSTYGLEIQLISNCSVNLDGASNNFNDAFGKLENRSTYLTPPYLQVVFAFGGFNQANYVLSEVYKPQSTLRWTSLTTVSLICILYMLVNIAFLTVVPIKDNKPLMNGSCNNDDWSMASDFFQLTFGSRRLYNGFLMTSSLGNIIVTTFTAGRVKQEIARVGVLPLAEFFSKSYDMAAIVKTLFGTRTDQKLEKQTPAAAIALHFMFSATLILVVAGVITERSIAYTALTGIYSYAIDAFFTSFLGFGLLCLRMGRNWGNISATKSVFLSVLSASGTAVGNAFPLIASWIVDPAEPLDFIGPAGGLVVIAIGVISWTSLRMFRGDKEYVEERKPFVRMSNGVPIRIYDVVTFSWKQPKLASN